MIWESGTVQNLFGIGSKENKTYSLTDRKGGTYGIFNSVKRGE